MQKQNQGVRSGGGWSGGGGWLVVGGEVGYGGCKQRIEGIVQY